MVYTWYFTCICRPDRYVRYILYTLSRPHGFVPYLFFYNDIPLIYYEYLKDIFDAEDAALGQNAEGGAAQPAAAKASGGARKTKPPAAAAAEVPEKRGSRTQPKR